MAQLQMLPRKAIVQYPKVEQTADSLGEVEADDGIRYFVKGDEPGRATRASEWLGTLPAECVGISVPAPLSYGWRYGFWRRPSLRGRKPFAGLSRSGCPNRLGKRDRACSRQARRRPRR
jgi:hypothetical protein